MSVLALSLVGVLAGPPATDPDFEAGKEAFAQGRYAEAAAAFERAYERQPEPLLLFVWAQAERRAGHCEVAVPLYRQYLTLDPPEADVAVTRDAIEACGEDPDLVLVPPPAPESEGEDEDESEDEDEGEPGPVEPPPERTPRAAVRDPWGHALTWTGVVVAGIGAGLLGTAHARRTAGDRAMDEQEYREALSGAPALSRAGIALLAGGGALLVAGVVRFSVVAVRGRRSEAAAALRPRGLGLTWKFELAPRRPWALR